MCLYVLSSVMYCPLRFPHKNDVWFLFTLDFCRKTHVLFVSYMLNYAWLCQTRLDYMSNMAVSNTSRLYEQHGRCLIKYVTKRYHNTSSVSSMIEQLEWTTLQERRKHSRLLMMYKLKNNIVRVDASSKLIPNERPSRNNNEQALPIPSCKTTVRKDSFYPRTTKEWNTLPNCTVSQSVPRVLNPSRLGSVIKLK